MNSDFFDNFYDVIVLGGGAAGLMAAATAGARGRSVLVIEVSNKLGKKILMSGGGKCNFTNLEVKAEHFISSNPHFVKSALSQYSNWDFIGLVAGHGIEYHEKDHGQLFCDNSSKDILNLLINECEAVEVKFRLDTLIEQVKQVDTGFSLSGPGVNYKCESLIVATGGLSIPTLGGATGFGYKLAQQFGLAVMPRDASLVPFTLTGALKDMAAELSGVSLPVYVHVPNKGFYEQMLFTHRGLSGPSILQLSNYWHLGDQILIDLLPDFDVSKILLKAKAGSAKVTFKSAMSLYLPASLSSKLVDHWAPDIKGVALQEVKDQDLRDLGNKINAWKLVPSGTEGYRTAEVTRGGVSVDQISSKKMQHKKVENLYFVGEVLDVTGHLGGFNFQWAWSSGYVAGKNA